MALSILDGNQSATTLSTILSSGQHITAHTVVSLGTQAITDIVNATSSGLTNTQLRASAVTIGGTVTANGLALGEEVLNVFPIGIGQVGGGGVRAVADFIGFRVPISLGESQAVVSASLSDPLPAGTNRIGVVTIGAGTVTIGAGTAQIGSVTASISGTPSVTFGLISGTVTANTFALQGTAVTTSNFTSTTASTVLANFNATREVLTIFNEGAGNLHICAGATCTTIAYQVRLSAGDYYEVPNHQTSLTHSAVFATAGTARVCQVS